MNGQHKKNKRTIIILFSMSIIPFFSAWVLSKNTDWIEASTNNGQLITPPVTTEIREFIGFDDFSLKNMKEIQGRWVLVNVIPNKDCDSVCLEAMYKTKQLRLMMNKDLTRIRRIVLMLTTVSADDAKQWWKDDPRLLRSTPASSLAQKLKIIKNSKMPEGMLFLMDPLGNLMMQYEPEFDPYKVKSDLYKLLTISQIG